jgi:hypothetical protein
MECRIFTSSLSGMHTFLIVQNFVNDRTTKIAVFPNGVLELMHEASHKCSGTEVMAIQQ